MLDLISAAFLSNISTERPESPPIPRPMFDFASNSIEPLPLFFVPTDKAHRVTVNCLLIAPLYDFFNRPLSNSNNFPFALTAKAR